MEASHLIIYIITLAISIICLTIITYALRHRSIPGATSLAVIMAAVMGYAIPYTLQFTSHDLASSILWYNISTIGANLIGPSWLFFSLSWSNPEWIISKQKMVWQHIGVVFIPAIVSLACWTNSLHHLYGSNFHLSMQGNLPILVWNFGLFYWVGLIYSYVIASIGIIVLLITTRRRLRIFFHQTVLILCGAFIPAIFNLAHVNGYISIGKIDIAPFSFLVTGVMWSVSIFIFRFLRIIPIAHQNVFKRMPIGMIVLDYHGTVVDINPSASEILNTPLVTVIGRALPDHISNLFFTPQVNPTDERIEIVTLELKGEQKYLEIHFSPFQDSNKKLIGTLLLFSDITSKVKVENALKESESRMVQAQAVARVGNWELDLKTRQLWASSEVFHIYGIERSSEYLSLETAQIIVVPNDRPALDAALTGLIQNNEPYNLEFRINRQNDSSQRVIHSEAILIKDPNGIPRKVVGIIQDITEHRQAEDALHKSEERFKQLAEVFPETIFEADLSGKLTYTNDYGYQCFNITESDISQGINIMSLVVPEDCQKVQQRIQERFNGKTGEFLEYKAIRKNGETFDALAYASLIRNNGQIDGLRGFILDISERKHIEQALLDSESNFRTFFETIDDIILVATPDGKIIFGNKALGQKLGYTSDDLSTMHVLDLNPSDMREEAETIFAAMIRGERNSCPLPLVTKDRYLIPAETRVWLGKWNGVDCVFGVCKDLTNEREAQHRFESLFRNNPTLMALSSIPDRHFTDVNNAFLSTLGYTSDEIIGKTSAELGLFINLQQQEELANQLRATGRFNDMELQVRRKDGKILDGLFSGEIISSHGKEFYLTVMSDITERKRIESALQESELYFRSLFEQAAVGVAVVDSKSGSFLQVNQRFCEILGYSRKELDGVAFKNITHPDDIEISLVKMKDMISGKINKFTMEKRYISKTGKPVWVTLNVAAMWFPGEDPSSFITIVQDITDQKTAEAALRESDAKMRAIAESAQDAILMIDPHGNVSYWNPAAETILGYTYDEALGQNLHQLIVPQRYHQAYQAAFPTFTKTGQGDALGKSHEMYAIRKDGTEIPIRLSLSAFQMNNEWFATGIISDITEQKRSEKIQQIVYKIAQSMVSETGIDEQYPFIHNMLKELLPADNFYIALYDSVKNLISYPYVVDQYDEPPAPKRPGHGLTEYVLRTGRSILVTPEVFDELLQKGEVEPIGSDSVDWMGSPLIVEGRIIGVMVLQSYSETIRYQNDDVKLLEFVSNQVALSIERKYAQEILEHQSTHDKLTGLFNRQYYETEIERMQNSRQFPITIFMMDMDGLKMTNDLFGHSKGDELLQRAVGIIKSSFRPEDMVARVGGDEFAAVLPGTDTKTAALILRRLKKAFLKHNQGYSQEQMVNISIGMATGDQYCQLTEVFKEADQAMYKAKAMKKAQIVN